MCGGNRARKQKTVLAFPTSDAPGRGPECRSTVEAWPQQEAAPHSMRAGEGEGAVKLAAEGQELPRATGPTERPSHVCLNFPRFIKHAKAKEQQVQRGILGRQQEKERGLPALCLEAYETHMQSTLVPGSSQFPIRDLVSCTV